MPWHIEKGGGDCADDQWAVIKDSDGSTAGCHDTQEDAQAQLDALYASESAALARAGLEQREEDMAERAQVMAAAREARADALGRTGGGNGFPAGAARMVAFPSVLEARMEQRNGKDMYHVHGTATAYEVLYEMWDMFGPYEEGVHAGAGANSLSKKPDVAFLENHRGITMARTTNDTLDLEELASGLDYDAYLNPERTDVRNLYSAITDGLITESSFAFMIIDGSWNQDFDKFWINEYEINRGDVSAVNYGANPYTSVAGRARQLMADLDYLPAGAARAAYARLASHFDLGPGASQSPPATDDQPGGLSTELVRMMLLADQ
jgi:HK97 family phage prohead protease